MSPLELLGMGAPATLPGVGPQAPAATTQSATPFLQAPEAATPEQSSESHFVKVMQEYRQSSHQARQQHREKWDTCWDLFTNTYDFTKKADWQSKGWIPKIPTLVRSVSALIKTALFASREFGTIDGVGEQSKAKAPMMKKLTLHVMEEGHFIDKFVEALMAGMLTPGVNLKIYPKVVEADTTKGSLAGPANFSMTDKKVMICFEPVSEFFLFRDPTGSNKWLIHEIEMDLADLKDLAKNPANGYETTEVDNIHTDFEKQEEEYRKQLRDSTTPTATRPPFRKRVKLWEFWGEIPNQDGTLAFRNGTMTLANEKYLVRKPMQNPYDHKEWPILSSFLTMVPFSVWHESYVWAVSALAKMITENFNLTMDGNLYESIRSFQIELDFVADPAELANGIYPGKAIKSDGAMGKPIIQTLDMGHVSPGQQAVYQVLSGEFQNGASSSEYSIPQLASKRTRETTKFEVQKKSEQADMFTNDLSQTIERQIIEKALRMTKDLLVQYFDGFHDPAIVDLLGRDAMIMQLAKNDEERKMLMGGQYICKSRAISGILKKREKLEAMKIIAEEMKEFPLIASLANPVNWLKQSCEILDLDPKELFNLPEETPDPYAPSPLGALLIKHRMAQGQQPFAAAGIEPPSMGQQPAAPPNMPMKEAVGGLAQ